MIPVEMIGSSQVTEADIRRIVREELVAFKESNNG